MNLRALFLLVAVLWPGVSALVEPVLAYAQEEETGDGKNPSGAAPPSFSPHAATDTQTFSGSSISTSITITNANDGAMVGLVVFSATVTGPSVTVGGIACTMHDTASGGGETVQSWSCPGSIGAGSKTCAASWTGSTAGGLLECEDWTGIASSAQADGGNAAAAVAGPGTLGCGSFTPAANGDLIWHFYYQPNSVAPTSTGVGFTANATGLTTGSSYSEYLIQPTAAAVSPTYVTGATAFSNYFSCAGVK